MSDQATEGAPLVLQCAWCERVRDPFDVWGTLPLPDVLRLQAAGKLTYCLCPGCLAVLVPDGAPYAEPV